MHKVVVNSTPLIALASIDKLIKNGFYIDDKLYDQILQIVGEI